jgi:hypothetical protein
LSGRRVDIQQGGELPEEGAVVVAGVGLLKSAIVFALVLAFAGLYAYFMVRIWQQPSGHTPRFDNGLVSVAGVLAGILGGGFALALGVAKPAAGEAPSSRLGNVFGEHDALKRSLNKVAWISVPVTVGIWTYAIIGTAAATTTVVNTNETPDVVKALASVFGGYIFAVGTLAFRSVRST